MMTPATLEFETSSTTQAGGTHDQWISTTANKIESSWFAPFCKFDYVINVELDRVAALKPNWDAEGASPIDREVIIAARELVSRLPQRLKDTIEIPAVVPMARGPERSGNLQFEWDNGLRSLELEIEDATTVHYLQWQPEEQIEREDFFAIDDVQAAESLIRWFAGS